MRFPVRKIAAAAALPLLTAACTATPAATPKTAATTSPPSASPDAGLLTGTQLKTRLMPASWFPAGFSPDRSGSVNTGNGFQAASPAAAPPDCARMDATSWVALAGPGSVAFAQDDYINHTVASEYAQEIDSYQGTGAQQTMAGLRKLAATCPHFRDAQTSSTVTVTLRHGPPLGDDALIFRLDSPRWAGGTTLEAVRAGHVIVSVFFSAVSGTGQAQATRLAAAVTAKLTGRP